MTTKFQLSICDPLQPKVVKMDFFEKDEIISFFSIYPWNDYLASMNNKPEEEVFYSPSIGFENIENEHAIEITAVGEPKDYIFYVFYKRPKMKETTYFLNHNDSEQEFELLDILDQSNDDVIKCLEAFIENDSEQLAILFET